jgi:hypothetical protein
MSYDLWSFPVPSGEDPLEMVQRFMEAEEDAEVLDPDPAKEARKRILAERIVAGNPKMEPFVLQYEQIAEMQKITVAEAKRKYRYIELDCGEGGNGVQVTLHDDHATVTVPYWHQGAQAEAVFTEIWGYLRVLHEEGDCLTYDPQLERMLDLGKDFTEVLKRYVGVARQVKASSPEIPKATKPWWKFW